MAELIGRSIIGFHRGVLNGDTFHAVNPVSGEELPPDYHAASAAEVEKAVQLASSAVESYRRTAPKLKATFLREIAENIERLGDVLVLLATSETALPAPPV